MLSIVDLFTFFMLIRIIDNAYFCSLWIYYSISMTGNRTVVFNERQSLFPVNELVSKHGEASSDNLTRQRLGSWEHEQRERQAEAIRQLCHGTYGVFIPIRLDRFPFMFVGMRYLAPAPVLQEGDALGNNYFTCLS